MRADALIQLKKKDFIKIKKVSTPLQSSCCSAGYHQVELFFLFPNLEKHDHLYGFAHSQSPRAFLNLMCRVIGRRPQQLRSVQSADRCSRAWCNWRTSACRDIEWSSILVSVSLSGVGPNVWTDTEPYHAVMSPSGVTILKVIISARGP